MKTEEFHTCWQLHNAARTCAILQDAGYWAQVYSGNRYGDQPYDIPPGRRSSWQSASGRAADEGMIYPYVLTNAPAEELLKARDAAQSDLSAPLEPTRSPAHPTRLNAEDYARREFEDWRTGAAR